MARRRRGGANCTNKSELLRRRPRPLLALLALCHLPALSSLSASSPVSTSSLASSLQALFQRGSSSSASSAVAVSSSTLATPTPPPQRPGQSFASPVLWAPWLGSKWRGNLYDYRGAYFQDVMYANGGRPFQEGCLLYSNVAASEQISLLYQRYAKFDSSSYAVANATFFNLQGAASLRLGRYQIPLTEKVELHVQTPLTYDQIKEYLNAPSIAKSLVNSKMQKSREKTYHSRLPPPSKEDGGDSSTFFRNAVFDIEYSRVILDAFNCNCAELPITPYPSLRLGDGLEANRETGESDAFALIDDVRGLVVSMDIANSQYYLETLIQSVLNKLLPELLLQPLTVYSSSDGHCLANWASELVARMATANGVSKVAVLTGGDTLSGEAATRGAEESLTFRWTSHSDPSASDSSASDSSASDFGLHISWRPHASTTKTLPPPPAVAATAEIADRMFWSELLASWATTHQIKINCGSI